MGRHHPHYPPTSAFRRAVSYLLILPSMSRVRLSEISMLTHPSDTVRPPPAAHLPPPSRARPFLPSHPCPSLPVISRTDQHFLGHMLGGVSVRSYPPASVLPADFPHTFYCLPSSSISPAMTFSHFDLLHRVLGASSAYPPVVCTGSIALPADVPIVQHRSPCLVPSSSLRDPSPSPTATASMSIASVPLWDN